MPAAAQYSDVGSVAEHVFQEIMAEYSALHSTTSSLSPVTLTRSAAVTAVAFTL